jgi:fibronectin-binding autotransporter adhesin
VASNLGASSSAAGNLVFNGGTLRFDGEGGSTNRLFTIGTGGANIENSGFGSLFFTNTGAIDVNSGGATHMLVLSGPGISYFSPTLGDDGLFSSSLVKAGSGTWLMNSVSTFTGDLLVEEGTLEVGNHNVFAGNPAAVVETGAILELGWYSTSLGSLAGTGTVDMDGGEGATELTVGANNQSTSFTGVISGTGDNSLLKVGTGNLYLGGANTYAGGTVIEDGTITAGHNSALGSGSIILDGGGILVASGVVLNNSLVFSGPTTLGGSGTFGTTITAGTGVTVSPGSSPGVITFMSGLTLADGGAITFEIQDANGEAGVGYDLISVTGGTFALTAGPGGITFNLKSLDALGDPGDALNFNPASNYSWLVAQSSTAIVGFDPDMFNLVSFFSNDIMGGTFAFGLSGEDQQLFLHFTANPIPEPSTWLLLVSGLGAMALRLRRRRA